ncbi:hypothetical protein AMTRI_Chr02g257510 [Amborella trichopoda]
MLSFDPNRFHTKPINVRSKQPKPIVHNPSQVALPHKLKPTMCRLNQPKSHHSCKHSIHRSSPSRLCHMSSFGQPSYTTDPSVSCPLPSLVSPSHTTSPS